MQKAFTALVILLITHASWGQSRFDSLEIKLEAVDTEADSLLILYDLTSHFAIADNEKSFSYADTYLKLAERIGDSTEITKAHLMMGKCLVFAGKMEEAKQQIQRIEDHAFQNETKLAIQTGQYLGNINRTLGYLDTARMYYDRALEKSSDSSDWYNLQKPLIALEYAQGKVSLALERSLIVLDYEQRNNAARIASTCNNIAVIYSNKNEPEKALEFYLMAIEEGLKNPVISARSLLTAERAAAKTLLSLKRFDEAKLHLKEALKRYEKFDNPTLLSQLLYVKAELFVNEGVIDSAQHYYNQIIELTDEMQHYEQKLNAIVSYLNFSFTQGNYEVKPALITQLEEVNESVNLTMMKSIHEILNLYYLEKKDFEKSRHHLNQYWVMNDSIEGIEQENYISELETKYETAKKDNEIAYLSQQSQIQALMISQRNTQLMGAGVVLIFLVIGGFVFYNQRKLRHQQAVSDMEQRMLRLQMNPHFIFNALASIQSYILQSDTRESVSYLAKFGKLMRQILEHSREESITVAEEVDMLKNYIAIQQLRFKGRFDYQIDVDPNIDLDQTNIPPLFAQPFVENAIEHGLKDKSDDGMVMVRFKQSGSQLLVEVEDNGSGLVEETSVNDHKSLATTISRERLDMLGKRFRQKFKMSVINTEHSRGVKASVELPVFS